LTLFFAIFPLPCISIHFEAGFGNFYAFILEKYGKALGVLPPGPPPAGGNAEGLVVIK
jgi:hypothetical protein